MIAYYLEATKIGTPQEKKKKNRLPTFPFLQFAHELYNRDSDIQISKKYVLPAVSLFETNHYSFHISNVTAVYGVVGNPQLC